MCVDVLSLGWIVETLGSVAIYEGMLLLMWKWLGDNVQKYHDS